MHYVLNKDNTTCTGNIIYAESVGMKF